MVSLEISGFYEKEVFQLVATMEAAVVKTLMISACSLFLYQEPGSYGKG